ncbi:MAG TPA: hypothetical protein VLY23_14175 [Candidatus Acidoferrum sp.]|nr:hypothetical protein [Candidatus Acidoferrum sp.]
MIPLLLPKRSCARTMQPRRGSRRRASRQSGYAYLMALLMVLVVLASSVAIMLNAATQARRQREEDMIWRGRQYVRAIKLYYRRTGHYPQNVDDLENGLANIHFLRDNYKDPMNTAEDGSWRFIYTNASGQIIGSVRYATMQQMAILDLNGGQIPGVPSDSDSSQSSGETPVPQPDQGTSSSNCPPAGTSTTSASPAPPASAPPTFGGAPPPTTNPNPGSAPPPDSGQVSSATCPPAQVVQGALPSQGGLSLGTQPGGMQVPGVQAGMQLASLQALMQMKPTGAVDGPVIGGFLVGVGSKVDAKSQKVWKGGKKYNQWEFIWNPLEDQALALQQGMGQGVGMGGLLGQPGGIGGNPAPTSTGPGISPVQAPTTPQQPPQP